jgi:hypothetical protein
MPIISTKHLNVDYADHGSTVGGTVVLLQLLDHPIERIGCGKSSDRQAPALARYICRGTGWHSVRYRQSYPGYQLVQARCFADGSDAAIFIPTAAVSPLLQNERTALALVIGKNRH